MNPRLLRPSAGFSGPIQAAVAAGANSANYNVAADWNGQDGNLTTVGTNGGPSAYGTFDQNGQVNEWHDFTGSSGSSRRLRGGDWGNSSFSLSSSNVFESAASDEFNYIGFRLASSSNPLSLNFVTVGNIGNSNDSTGYGRVTYQYQIGKYLITNAEYAAFLNARAATDTYGLFSASMGSDARGGISRSGTSGSYTYATRGNRCAKPVNYVSWFDAARYANWLHNGMGAGDTETGAYTLNGATTGNAPAKNAGAKYWIPTENEWYKAAYHKSGGRNTGYWSFATQSNTNPTAVAADATGNGPITTAYSCVETPVVLSPSLWKVETLQPSYHWSA